MIKGVFFILSIALISVSFTSISSAWWSSSWSYRVSVNVSNTLNSNLTSYQVKIITNVTDEYLAGKISSTCNDIRFLDSDDTTILDHWEESCNTTGDNSTFWINISLLENNTNASIYMYYGNPSASSISNIHNTFLFGDEFTGSSYWTKLTDMSVKRHQHGVELLDGIVYVVLGENENEVQTNTTYAYNISNNSWSRRNTANSPKVGQSPVLRTVNGKLYLIGGLNRTSGEHWNQTWEYDPSTNNWTQKADMPTARQDMASAVVGDSIYVFGGLTTLSPFTISPNLEIYNTTNNSWST